MWFLAQLAQKISNSIIVGWVFLWSTELKSIMFESKLHVFAIKLVSTSNLENSISVYVPGMLQDCLAHPNQK